MNLHVYHIVYTLRAFASKVVLYDFQSVAVVDKTALLLSVWGLVRLDASNFKKGGREEEVRHLSNCAP